MDIAVKRNELIRRLQILQDNRTRLESQLRQIEVEIQRTIGQLQLIEELLQENEKEDRTATQQAARSTESSDEASRH